MKECNFTGSEKVSDSKYNDSANNDKEKEAFKLTNELKDKSYDKDFKPSHELKSKSDDRKFKPFHESKNKENKWDKIDWNKINSDKKSPNKWDEVDWNNLNSKKEKLDEKNTKDNLNVKVKDNTMKSEIKDDNTNEIKTNDVNKNNFKNLSNDIVNTHFKQYRNETKKFPNKGLELTIEFIKWIENEENVIIEKNELIKAYYDINNTQEIPSYISFQNKNTDFTAYKISDDLFKLGLKISGK